MNISNFIGYFELSKNVDDVFKETNNKINYKKISINKEDVFLIEDFLNTDEIIFLINEMKNNKNIPVGIDGIAKNYIQGGKIHSYRSTVYNEELANKLYKRINFLLENRINIYESNKELKHYNINPSFRYINYSNDGILVPHYDFPYKKGENDLSLMSLVLYLTDNKNGGSTQFIKECRENDTSDWKRVAKESEVLVSFEPKAGSALIFPHNMLHQSLLSKEEKIIIRTDVMFKDL